MKQYLIKGFLFAGVAILSVPALAQKEKEKEDKEMQCISITRKGNTDEKTVIEIKGDKVLINGKEAKNSDDVSVNVSKVRDYSALARSRVRSGGGDFNFDFDNDGPAISLFNEDANRAMLGVTPDDDDKGAKVTAVTPGSAAEKAGLKKGDVITRIGSQKIEEADDVSKVIRSHKPGDKVDITYLREGKEQKISTELGKWKGAHMPSVTLPNEWRDELPRIQSAPNGQGWVISGNTPKLGLSVQDTDDGKGVKVLDVSEQSNAAKAGLKEGDIITRIDDKDVNSTDEVTRTVKANKEKPSMKFQVLRNGKTQTLEVRTPRKIKTADL